MNKTTSLMTSFSITKLSSGVELPNGFTISSSEFVARAGKCGFDKFMTSIYLDRLNDGGKWILTLNDKQRRIMNGTKKRPAGKGF